ncbi:helix-turn-helix domain-containing protein [Streptomyces sp. 2P-4]|uniref:PucR family transcriptional regulator n=1 Tax=Streptomyces sp. 2P-4 TaxID=2931974 RepID=UPI002541479B|nr:helix-turn-helix domain-containing protein [Streptomyces sp. 2P-4]
MNEVTMCELLNRIWARPRGEWTRVLRRELPALASGMVEELRDGIPGFAALVDDLDDEVVRAQVEAALLTALGYREPVTRPQERAEAHGAAPDGGPEPVRAGPYGTPAGHPDIDDDTDGDGGGRGGIDPDEDIDLDVAALDAAAGLPGGALHGPGLHGGGADPVLDRIPRQSSYRTRTAPLTVVASDGPGSTCERARRELFSALISDMPMAEIALSELARAAGWPLPPEIRAIALATPGETQQLAASLGDALAGMVGGQPCLLLPSPEDPDTRTALEPLLRGRFAAVGHPVAPRDTSHSLRWALRLLALAPHRPGPEGRPLFVDDHLSTLLLLQDEPLAHALAARWLRPLADLTPRQSERLEVTLLAWLEGGGAPEAAKALSVHPQTVRYRMRQLEKLFGPGLRDPRTRFELEMALRSRRLMAQVRRQYARVGRKARAAATDFRPLGVDRMARVNGL